MKGNKILYVQEIISSKRDVYGNSYHASVVVRCSDGATARGTVDGGPSNARCGIKLLCGGNWNLFRSFEKTVPIREFNQTVKGWADLGCTDQDIKANIEKMFTEDTNQ